MNDALEIFRALADPTRLRMLALLRAMELSIGELAQVLGQSQPRVSRHVKILADAGIARRRKEGSWVFLSLGAAARVAPLLAAIDSWSGPEEGDDQAVADMARLAAVRDERARAAAEYFNAHAAEWDEMRSLHVAESQVEAAIRATLSAAPIGRLVDIGTGIGRMIELFGETARSVIGIDRSPEMLRLARAKLARAGLERAELRQGDFHALPLPGGCADTVIIHQVLHYAQQPETAVAEAARLLASGGRLLVVDFGPHEKEELRTRHAHARLGFTDEQIAGWFVGAGLETTPPQPLEGGELTVKLWLGQRPALADMKDIAA
ncbi:metalloregulator ArsR/SmtB family transcription factor [Acidocella sp.]|uniref:ArsR/SmtB family transcription factor n=1 Tax=Acidocella sp. TaxID=50710 RepID=UPI00260C5B71|nr:metalloregulator ArsR/SmtB family transcription factor [Acidocella sp.]MDD2795412.1 metalloregulator ArsR/SmtB family transcription factor [Acidocella sp.]